MAKNNLLRILTYLYSVLVLTECSASVSANYEQHAQNIPAKPKEISWRRTVRARPYLRAQIGIASWYGPHHQGKITASGQRFDFHKLTAAHKTLPFNTKARVINLENGKSVEVTINDRGPYVRGRVIDLSERAARRIGMEKKGLARVEIEPVGTRVALE